MHDAIDTFGLDGIVDLTGMERIRLQRYRRGETWPSWETQRRFHELLAADLVAKLRDPLPTR